MSRYETETETVTYEDVECPLCHDDKHIYCVECGSPANECECIVNEDAYEIYCNNCEDVFTLTLEEVTCICNPPGKLLCYKCGVMRESIHDPWQRKENFLTNEIPMPIYSTPTATTTKSNPCRHYWQAVPLNDAVVIYCSSMNNDRKGGAKESPIPDFGLYADYGWKPTWRNEFINWPDFNVPKDQATAFTQIRDAYDRIVKQDQNVEIGCIGGHGRTGTILACMYVLANDGKKSGVDAVDWVRENYCHHAIENKQQEFWVRQFYYHVYGGKNPGEYTAATSSTGSVTITCSAIDHYAMFMRGHKHCHRHGPDCKWWKQDMADIQAGKMSNADTAKAISNLEAFPLRRGGKMLEKDKASAHSIDEHYAMYLEDWTECAILGEFCKWWKSDLEDFKDSDQTDNVDALEVEILRDEYKQEK